MATPSHQPLPSKEAGLFRQLVKLYESKQYKKAIKAADQILKKFPDHGETLAMKVRGRASNHTQLAGAAAAQQHWFLPAVPSIKSCAIADTMVFLSLCCSCYSDNEEVTMGQRGHAARQPVSCATAEPADCCRCHRRLSALL